MVIFYYFLWLVSQITHIRIKAILTNEICACRVTSGISNTSSLPSGCCTTTEEGFRQNMKARIPGGCHCKDFSMGTILYGPALIGFPTRFSSCTRLIWFAYLYLRREGEVRARNILILRSLIRIPHLAQAVQLSHLWA